MPAVNRLSYFNVFLPFVTATERTKKVAHNRKSTPVCPASSGWASGGLSLSSTSGAIWNSPFQTPTHHENMKSLLDPPDLPRRMFFKPWQE